MNLVNKMNRFDKQQVNELIHCKVSHFKSDLIEQLRRLIEQDDLDPTLIDLDMKSISRLSINKRKFSSSEDDDKLDSNSNSLESNDKSDSHETTLSLNKLLNSWKSPELKDDRIADKCDLECNEKLIDKDVLLIANHFNNLSNSLNHPLLSPNHHSSSKSSKLSSPSSKSQSESIEKSFNESFACLNGVSVQLIGNIRLQLTSSQNSISSFDNQPSSSSSSSKIDKSIDKSSGGHESSPDKCLLDRSGVKLNSNNGDLLMISECIQNDTKPTTTSLFSTSLNSSSSNSASDLKSKNFNIDKLIRDEGSKCSSTKSSTFGLFENAATVPSSSSSCSKEASTKEQLTNQLSASNDSSSSTLSAVSIDLSQTNSQQPSSNYEFTSNSSATRRRSSGSSTTASACSDRDCLTPPNRKHLKTENNTPFGNQSLNLITSVNSSINLEPLPSPYLSPSLPQTQLNDLLSPTDSIYKAKKSHPKLDRSTNGKIDDRRSSSSPNFHQKLNPTASPKSTSGSKASNKQPNPTNHVHHHSANRKTETTTSNENIALNPKMKKILKSYQELASNSMNGPEYYENLAMLANFHQQYGMRTLDPITAKIASAASAFLNGSGPVPDAQLLMNELTKLQLSRSEDSKSEIANLSINNLDNYLTKKSIDLINCKSTGNLQIKNSRDKETGKLDTTILESEKIACFNVGGEYWLCLPQILTTVLRTFTLHDINNVCDQFRIFCSRCNTEQLNMLKSANILPPGAPSCGLITKSDAERLCAMLFFYANLFPSQMQAKVKDPYSFYSDPDKRPSTVDDQPKLKLELKESQFILDLIKELPDEIRALVTEDQPLNRLQKIQALKTTLSFRVIHHCFGKCKGLLIPAFYQRYNSRCILCLECESLLSPNKFVLHTHKFNENQTCHWGFDSSNWRNLITLTKEDLNNPKLDILKKYLNEFKMHKIS